MTSKRKTHSQAWLLADGSTPTDGLQSRTVGRGQWDSGVADTVRDYYSKNQDRLGHHDLEQEVRWEIAAHERGRQKAIDELKRLASKGAASGHQIGEQLVTILTTGFIQLYYDNIRARTDNQNAQHVVKFFHLALGPEFLSDALPGWVGNSYHVAKVQDPGVIGYANLYSVGLLVARCVVDHIGNLTDNRTRDKRMPFSTLAAIVGQSINREMQSIGFARLNVDWYVSRINALPPGISPTNAHMRLQRCARHYFERALKTRRIKAGDLKAIQEHDDLRLPTTEDYLQHWNHDRCVQVGSAYLSLLIDAGILCKIKIRAKNGHNLDVVELGSQGQKVADELIERNLGSSFHHQPMLIPPLPHSAQKVNPVTGRSVGGYILDAYAQTHRKTISHSALKFHVQDGLPKGAEPEWVEALNQAQDLPLAINPDMERLIRNLIKDGAPVGEDAEGKPIRQRLNVHSLMLLATASASDTDRIKDAYNAKIEATDDVVEKASLTKELRYKCRRIHEQAIRDRTSTSRIKTLIDTLDALKEDNALDRFWLVWFLDTRRRYYALGALNPLEREVSKSLLLFADPLELDTDQRRKAVKDDLLWQISTTWGAKTEHGCSSDKLSRQDRILWPSLKGQQEIIEMVGRDPLSYEAFKVWAGEVAQDHLGRDVITGGASDPFCFVAACMEYHELFVKEGGRTSTRFLIHKDCTASGLQMAALSACSHPDSVLVNAAAPDPTLGGRPSDIYMTTFGTAIRLMREGFTYQINDRVSTIIIPDSRSAERLDAYGIGRGAAKPTVMTALYSADEGSNRSDVLQSMREEQRPFVPRFVGFDDKAEERLRQWADKEGKSEEVSQLLAKIDKIKDEDLQLAAKGRSAMELFEFSAEEEPIKPDSDAFDEGPDGQKEFERAQADYLLFHRAWELTRTQQELQEQLAAKRSRDVLQYIDLVHQAHGKPKLSPQRGKKGGQAGRLYVTDVDPLIKNLVRAVRTALAMTVPDIVRLRDELKTAIKGYLETDAVGNNGGAISWDMPHGWRTRQRHLINGDVNPSHRLRVFSTPSCRAESAVSFWASKVTEALMAGKSLEDVGITVKAPKESRQEWRRLSDTDVPRQDVDKDSHIKAIVANFCHSVDAALLTELRLQLSKRGVPCTQVHDCFWVRIGEGQQLMDAMAEAIKTLFGEAAGDRRPLDLFANSLGMPELIDKIRHPVGHERYFDPASEADLAVNFIC